MRGFEPLYLRPGMTDVELFLEFNNRNPYYRIIAHSLVENICSFGPRLRGVGRDRFGNVCDVLGRTGYAAWAAVSFAESITFVEHRPDFLEYLRREFDGFGDTISIVDAPSIVGLPNVLRAQSRLFDTVLCCEQVSQLYDSYTEFVSSLPLADGAVLGLTLGPSHHRFTTFRVADFRSGVVRDGEIMSELSHPIRQAAHRELVRLAKERHDYDRNDAWPPAAKAFDPAEVREANWVAGFADCLVLESAFPVPGSAIHLYIQNAWTSNMRFPPLADLPQDAKIALLKDSFEIVRAMPEYPQWCGVPAYHPVAFYIAW